MFFYSLKKIQLKNGTMQSATDLFKRITEHQEIVICSILQALWD